MSAQNGYGNRPLSRHLFLTKGQDFEAVVTNTEGAWPVGTQLAIDFVNEAGTTWGSWAHNTLDGADATWWRDKAEADVIPHNTVVRLRYVNGTVDRILSIGKVIRHDA